MLLVFLTSCEKFNKYMEEHTYARPASNADLTGTWTGLFSSNLISNTTGSFVLNQTTSGYVTGNFELISIATGSIMGSMNGDTFLFNITITSPTCNGQPFDVSSFGSPANDVMNISFHHDTCLQGHGYIHGNIKKL